MRSLLFTYDDADLRRRQALLLRHQRDLLFSHPESRVLENMVHAARISAQVAASGNCSTHCEEEEEEVEDETVPLLWGVSPPPPRRPSSKSRHQYHVGSVPAAGGHLARDPPMVGFGIPASASSVKSMF